MKNSEIENRIVETRSRLTALPDDAAALDHFESLIDAAEVRGQGSGVRGHDG